MTKHIAEYFVNLHRIRSISTSKLDHELALLGWEYVQINEAGEHALIESWF